jgi:hypothetical protein
VAIEAHQKTVLPLAKARKVALGVAESSHQGLEPESYGCLKKIVAEATGKPADINKIARPWLNAIAKGGRLLTEMRKQGELAAQGGTGANQYREQTLRGITSAKLFLSDLGFTRPRAARWQLAGALPDSLRMTILLLLFGRAHYVAWRDSVVIPSQKMGGPGRGGKNGLTERQPVLPPSDPG